MERHLLPVQPVVHNAGDPFAFLLVYEPSGNCAEEHDPTTPFSLNTGRL